MRFDVVYERLNHLFEVFVCVLLCVAGTLIHVLLALLDPLHDVLALRLVAELDEVKPLAHILRQILQVPEHLLRDERLELVKLLRHHVSAG